MTRFVPVLLLDVVVNAFPATSLIDEEACTVTVPEVTMAPAVHISR
jgi:hypothetical protein